MDEKNYEKGFNQGYLLQKHHPELAGKLQAAIKDSEQDRDQGFMDGVKEYKVEELDKELENDKGYPIGSKDYYKKSEQTKGKDGDMNLERD